VLTTVQQVHGVDAQHAAQHLPVHLRGVVTSLSAWPNAFFFQDATGGISLESDKPTGAFVGAEVEVTGETAPGLFAPIVHVLGVRVLDRGKMPPAPFFTYTELVGGLEDSTLITMRGVVRSAKPGKSWDRDVMTLQVETDGGLLIVQVLEYKLSDANWLVDAKVRLQGVCTTALNDKRQFTGVHLLLPSIKNVTVEEAAPSDPFALPIVPVRNLLQFQPGARVGHRVRVTGHVTYQDPGHSLYIQDGNDGVLVQSDQQTPLQLGTRIEAVGFAGSGAYSPILNQAIFRPLQADAPVTPAAIHANDFLHRGKFITAHYDAQLVRLQGQVVEKTSELNGEVWLLRERDSHFVAILPRSSQTTPVPVVENGSTISVTGVFSVQVDEDRQPTSFRVLLRGPGALVVVQRASWWTPTHAVTVLVAVLIATIFITLWGALLRRTVRRQTQLLRESEQRFREQAQHDALTGLMSRSFLLEQLHLAVCRAPERHEKLGVLIVDLDHFKQVNDTFGHHAGDELLCLVADRIRRSVRKEDTVARMGGDEFVVLLPGLKDVTEAELIGAKLVASVSAPAEVAGRAMLISASVGVCLFPDGGTTCELLLQNGDAAMYQAKAAGRNSLFVYRAHVDATGTVQVLASPSCK